MSYPWTRVPSGKPPIDGVQRRLLPIADLVMGVLWSRPGGMSLRTTWVTPATILLGVPIAAAAAIASVAAIWRGLASGQALLTIGGVLLGVVAASIGCVALYGIRQRMLPRTSS